MLRIRFDLTAPGWITSGKNPDHIGRSSLLTQVKAMRNTRYVRFASVFLFVAFGAIFLAPSGRGGAPPLVNQNGTVLPAPEENDIWGAIGSIPQINLAQA